MRTVLVIAIAATLARALLFVGLAPYADESYYWLWSTRPATGYFDHAPMVAWLAGLSSVLPGVLGLRALFLLCGGLTIVVAAATARDLLRAREPDASSARLDQVAMWAALLAASAPMLTLTGALALPDAPQNLFSALVVWLASRATGRLWIAAGLALGLATLTKYSSGLLAPALLSAAVFDPTLRAELRTRWPWLGVVAAFLVFLPCLAWNAAHDFVSIRFQFGHGFAGGAFGRHVGDWFAGLLGGAGPVVAIAGLASLLLRDRTSMGRRIAAMVVVPLAVLAWSSLRGKIEANWLAFVFAPLAAAAAAELEAVRSGRALVWASVAFGVLATVVYGVELRTPRLFPPAAPPIERFHGWSEQVARVEEICGPPGFAIVSNYQVAAQLAWFGGWRHFSASWARPSHLDVWGDTPRPGESRCFVALRNKPEPAQLAALGLSPDLALERVDATLAGGVIRTLWVARVEPVTQ